MQKVSAVGWIVFFLILFSPMAPAETFFGEVPTGVIELKEFRYPVFLSVPADYDPKRAYSLLVALPDGSQTAEACLKSWEPLAKKNGWILLAAGLERREGEVPYKGDEWLLRVKREVARRYHVAPEKTYLVGPGKSAHYAAYLGLNYPAEFAGTAVLGGSWAGPLDAIRQPSGKKAEQRPFFVALPRGDKTQDSARAKAGRLTQKGYAVRVEEVEPRDLQSERLKRDALAWLGKQGRGQSAAGEARKPWKERFRAGVHEFFHIE